MPVYLKYHFSLAVKIDSTISDLLWIATCHTFITCECSENKHLDKSRKNYVLIDYKL